MTAKALSGAAARAASSASIGRSGVGSQSLRRDVQPDPGVGEFGVQFGGAQLGVALQGLGPQRRRLARGPRALAREQNDIDRQAKCQGEDQHAAPCGQAFGTVLSPSSRLLDAALSPPARRSPGHDRGAPAR